MLLYGFDKSRIDLQATAFMANINSINQAAEQMQRMISSIDERMFSNLDAIATRQLEVFNRYNALVENVHTRQIQQFTETIQSLDVVNQVNKITQTVESIVQITSQHSDSVVSIIEKILATYDEVWKRYIADISTFVVNLQTLPSNEIFQDLLRLAEESEHTKDAFSSANWNVAPSMPKQLRQRVIELHFADKTRYISNVILGFYRRENFKNLRQAVAAWEVHPLFSPRMIVINDALHAHCEGRYTLSVPALMPHIEGILTEYVKSTGLAVRYGKPKEIYKAAIGDTDAYGLSVHAMADTLLYQLANNTYQFTEFQKELEKSQARRTTNRHTLSHGIFSKYYTPANSLKVFLLLDAISALYLYPVKDE